MRKILLMVLVFISVAYADLLKEGTNAYNQGNYQKAAKLFKKAANQGNTEAQTDLGSMYYEGEGVRQDYKESAKWFKKAANQGDAQAQFSLGVMYLNGQIIRQNLSLAKELFGKACDGGYEGGCYNYKILNERGIQ